MEEDLGIGTIFESSRLACGLPWLSSGREIECTSVDSFSLESRRSSPAVNSIDRERLGVGGCAFGCAVGISWVARAALGFLFCGGGSDEEKMEESSSSEGSPELDEEVLPEGPDGAGAGSCFGFAGAFLTSTGGASPKGMAAAKSTSKSSLNESASDCFNDGMSPSRFSFPVEGRLPDDRVASYTARGSAGRESGVRPMSTAGLRADLPESVCDDSRDPRPMSNDPRLLRLLRSVEELAARERLLETIGETTFDAWRLLPGVCMGDEIDKIESRSESVIAYVYFFRPPFQLHFSNSPIEPDPIKWFGVEDEVWQVNPADCRNCCHDELCTPQEGR
jgi:hypothetical protein